jgi:hypothetical protein
MSDIKEAFPITADSSTGAGIAPISRSEGNSSSGIAGLISFAFKDSSGNVVLPQLTPQSFIPVYEEPEVDKFARGTNGGSVTSQDLATIVASLNKKYHEFKVAVSCFRESVFTLVHIDNVGGTPTETILGVWRTGPGQYTVSGFVPGYKDTTGGTGTQNFVLRGLNLTTPISTMDASLHCKEMI